VPPPTSVAVLYFENLSRDTADAYLAEGLTVELTARLGAVGRLQVAARTAVRRLQADARQSTGDLARALNVSYLVSGSVRRGGDRLRVEVELVRGATGARVWGEQYDRSGADILGTQEDIARAVATVIAGRLLPAERNVLARRPTRSAAAYDHYLRGNRFLFVDTASGTADESVAEYQAALRLDPGFAAARARLALVYALAVNWGTTLRTVPSDSLVPRGLLEADRALRQDSASVDAWVARAYLLELTHPRDFAGAADAIRRALRLDPSSLLAHRIYGSILRRLGDFASAIAQYERVYQLDPYYYEPATELALVYVSLRRYDEALRWAERQVALDSSTSGGYGLQARLLLGDTAGARREAEAWLRHRDLTQGEVVQLPLVRLAAAAGDSTTLLAHRERIGAAVARLSDPVSPRRAFQLGRAVVLVGDHEAALALLERIRPRGAWLWSYLVLPDFDPIRGDPRFQRVYEESRPPGAPRLP
jgi:TolB-like protein/Tfp pilus assembly protein PilF